ncbi:Plasmodium exported protein, unknown function [Plasmodium ovale curtisi]|nr:Plasmodium exported protein, unknown function [Plasmodium ovale curtisi]
MKERASKIPYMKTFIILAWASIFAFEITSFEQTYDNKIIQHNSLDGRINRLLTGNVEVQEVQEVQKVQEVQEVQEVQKVQESIEKGAIDTPKEETNEHEKNVNALKDDKMFLERIFSFSHENLQKSVSSLNISDNFKKICNPENFVNKFGKVYNKIKSSVSFDDSDDEFENYHNNEKSDDTIKDRIPFSADSKGKDSDYYDSDSDYDDYYYDDYYFDDEEDSTDIVGDKYSENKSIESQEDNYSDISSETSSSLKTFSIPRGKLALISKDTFTLKEFYDVLFKPIVMCGINYVKSLDSKYETAFLKVLTTDRINFRKPKELTLSKIKNHMVVIYPVFSYSAYTLVLFLLNFDMFTVGTTAAMLLGALIYVSYKCGKVYNKSKDYKKMDDDAESLESTERS